EDQLLARDYRIEIGDCLSRAWTLFTQNAGIVLGVTILVGLVFFGACFAIGLIGSVVRVVSSHAGRFIAPVLNQLFIAALTGPIAGGYFWFFLKLIRGEQAAVADAFAGFSKRGGQLMLCSTVQGIVQGIISAPLSIAMVMAGFSWRRGGTLPDISPALGAGLLGASFLAFIGTTYFTTVWIHSLFLIIDKGYKFAPALKLSFRLVHRRWWMTWVFLLVGGLIA